MTNWPWYLWAIIGAAFVMFGLPILMTIIGSLTGAVSARGSKQGA